MPANVLRRLIMVSSSSEDSFSSQDRESARRAGGDAGRPVAAPGPAATPAAALDDVYPPTADIGVLKHGRVKARLT